MPQAVRAALWRNKPSACGFYWVGVLATAKEPADMALVGARLHPLKGELKGFWSVKLSGNWRPVFRFMGETAVDIDLIDYH